MPRLVLYAPGMAITPRALAQLPLLDQRYRRIRELGRGGFGTVWEVEDQQSGEHLAAKVSNLAPSPEDEARILRESALLQDLRHPRLARFQGLCRAEEGRLALLYEMVAGRNLADEVDASPPDPERALAWLADLAEGLQALHDAGLVHRDVKPLNAMIEPDGRARLLDFGLVRPVRPGMTITGSGAIFGTPEFMAPEALKGLPPTPASDLWSLACVGFWLLEDHLPRTGASPAETLALRVVDSTLRFQRLVPELARRLTPLFRLALHPSPALRPRSVTRFSRDLLEALKEARPALQSRETVSLRPVVSSAEITPRKAARRGSTMRRRRRAAFASFGLVGLAAAATAAWLGRPGPLPPAPSPPSESQPPRPAPPALIAELGVRAIEELDRLAGARLDPEGGLREGDDAGDHLPSALDPDPWLTQVRYRHLPSVSLVRKHLADGGRIPEEVREPLRKADARFAEESLPRPFFPAAWIAEPDPKARPTPAILLDLLARDQQVFTVTGPSSGWRALALELLARTMTLLAERSRAGLSDRLPKALAHLPSTLLPVLSLASLSHESSPSARLREAFEAWIREPIDEFRAACLAAGEALRQDPGDEELAAIFALVTGKEVSVVLSGSLLREPVEVLVGGPVESSPVLSQVASAIEREQAVQLWSRVRDQAQLARFRALRRGRLTVAGGGRLPQGAAARSRWESATLGLLVLSLEDRDLFGASATYLRAVLGEPELSARVLRWLDLNLAIGLGHATSRVGLDPGLIRSMVERLKTYPQVGEHLQLASPFRAGGIGFLEVRYRDPAHAYAHLEALARLGEAPGR